MNVTDINDIAGRFDMSATEAERIAKTVDTENEFVSVWENEDWWADANEGTAP
jgi:hypothetical protein